MAPYILDYFQYHNKSIYDNSIMWLTSVALGMEALAMPIGGALYRKLGIRAVVIISSLIHRLVKIFFWIFLSLSVFISMFIIKIIYLRSIIYCWLSEIRNNSKNNFDIKPK